jgi:hypothetical protein
MSAQLASSPSFSLPGAASPSADVTTSPCHVTSRFLPHRVKMSSLHPLHLLTMLRPVAFPSQAKTETLNMHHRHRPPSSNSPTLTLHCYKKVILILITLRTTQPHLHFSYSLVRAPRHRSFTCAIVSFHHRPTSIIPTHNDIHDDELTDSLLLPKQLIGM